MSPASKSKPKSISTPKTGKEHSNKFSMKPSTLQSSSGHASPPSFSPPQTNGLFRTIDDPDDRSTSSAEYDSSSNNSCSGESEDHKDKPTVALLNDRSDKNRQKNERKHQRQKEKRAQELHERCAAFLTSRKLEAQSRQLVSMGFPADRATMSVIMNKGRMEECVGWLLHEEDDNDNKQRVSFNLEDKSSITIDISDELAKIAIMEVKHNCSRRDVERAVVSCEGDLSKVEENLSAQKKAASAPDPDESLDSVKSNVKNPIKTAPNPADGPRIRAAPVDKRRPISPAGAPKAPFIVMQRPKEQSTSTEMCRNDPTFQQFYPLNNIQAMPPPSPTEPRLSSHLWNSFASPSPNGWNIYGSAPNRDYTSIDWSVDLMAPMPFMMMDDLPVTWMTMFMGGNAVAPTPPPSPPLLNGGGDEIYLPGLQEGVGSLKEWSPFKGRDLFRVTRKLMTSPSI